MTAPSSIDAARSLHEQLESASPDLLRWMLTMFINTLMSAGRCQLACRFELMSHTGARSGTGGLFRCRDSGGCGEPGDLVSGGEAVGHRLVASRRR
jgi:putative transposase